MKVSKQIDAQLTAFGDELKSLGERLDALSAGELSDQATQRARALTARLGNTIQAHPIAAVGVAFGAGYLLMRVLRR